MCVRFSYRQKDCAVCEHWDGVRKTSFDKAWLDMQSDLQTGICKNPKALLATKGKPTKADYSCCLRFEKWSALK